MDTICILTFAVSLAFFFLDLILHISVFFLIAKILNLLTKFFFLNPHLRTFFSLLSEREGETDASM